MDVLFAVLPFADQATPAIGVSLLKAEIARLGYTSQVRYFALDFAEFLGPDLYGVLSARGRDDTLYHVPPTETLVGEWVFARAAFGARARGERAYVSRFLSSDPDARGMVSEIRKARRCAAAFVERWAQEIHSVRPRVVGFSTVFHQTCACLALARRLKQLPDPPVVVFGGANCMGAMGVQIAHSFPWIDYVCTAEGDEVFPLLLHRLLRGGDSRAIPGMVGSGDADGLSRPPLVKDLDQLPIPDYSEYFAQLRSSSLAAQVTPRVLIETSRGCWWGEKHHCTFCGLNAETMAFRAKSADRVLDELKQLSSTYGVTQIECVDNILHMRYLQTLFPRMAAEGLKLELFYEVKANLRHDQLRTLRDAGITSIQAGVESFSDEALGLMRKGCSGLQNIQLLRWCAELGLAVNWNLIYGFPGESPSEYTWMAALIPLIVHLPRPFYVGQIRLDRFSPNFDEARRFGLTEVRPLPAYRYVFPLADEQVGELAYFFTFGYRDGRDPRGYTERLRQETRRWMRSATAAPRRRPRLDLYYSDTVALIEDTRACAVQPIHLLRGLRKELYLLCDVAHSADTLAGTLGVSRGTVTRALRALEATKLMVERGGRYLSLAVFQTREGAVLPPITPRSSAIFAVPPA